MDARSGEGAVMQRREALFAGLAFSLGAAAMVSDVAEAAEPAGEAFDPMAVRRMAKDLAAKPYKAPEVKLPDPLAKLEYDQYRDIRFDTKRSLWRGQNLPFEVQLLHRGFLYGERVDLFEVVEGVSTPVVYNQDMFTFGKLTPPALGNLGFAGFRIHAPINKPDYFDEVCVFLGASYFRAVAKGQTYGLSARGLSIKTADPAGEEFPAFRSFWLEKPRPGAGVVVIHALLDSESATAAYRFTIRPGEETVIDVESVVYPRVEIGQIGIATMTSMFYFDASSRGGIDDFRNAVHDSDGLQLAMGRGDQLWRQLANPRDLQISVFADNHPRGFGLIQRDRQASGYQDFEANYEKRPSLWVEPIGDIGEGGVYLVEIPSRDEIHDNIVAFWRPNRKLSAKAEYNFTYRLHWCNEMPVQADLARIAHTSAGARGANTRLFVLDIAADKAKALAADGSYTINVSADHGKIMHQNVQPNPLTGGWRVSFELLPEGAKAVELRAQLMNNAAPVSEIWIYRWTA
jgi:glucans biosynthesis protein